MENPDFHASREKQLSREAVAVAVEHPHGEAEGKQPQERSRVCLELNPPGSIQQEGLESLWLGRRWDKASLAQIALGKESPPVKQSQEQTWGKEPEAPSGQAGGFWPAATISINLSCPKGEKKSQSSSPVVTSSSRM